jgi:hypothetical protein
MKREMVGFRSAILASVFAAQCTGAYGGIDGPSVIARNEAVSRINDAKLARMAVCGYNSAGAISLYNDYVRLPRKVLDGAYYATRDVDRCVESIWLTPCNQWPLDCGLSPKEIAEPPLLEGGI